MKNAILLLVYFMFCREAESIIVKVKHGKLLGEKLRVVTGDAEYLSFKGIPYAKPPVGDLRFMAPQPPQPWTGVKNATQHSSICVQLNIYNNHDIMGSEDCLYLNVYTPSVKPKKLLPVLFFIHGGGFQTGSGNVDRYGPDYLIIQNIVIVTINYRLGPLGFLSLNTKEVPGNAGLKDQVAAMRWVKKNIAVFGGDPSEVTILGQSSAAACVGLHNLSPMTKNLYKRSVMMSGAPLNDWALQPIQPRRLAFKLGQQLGLWTFDDQKLLEFLKGLPAERLLSTQPAVLRSEDPNVIMKQVIFAPNVENDFGDNFLTSHPVKALRQGKMHNVDLMIGHTAEEGLLNFVLLGETIMSLYTNYSEMVVPRRILENTAPAKIFNIADCIRTQYFGNNFIDKNVAKNFVKFISDVSYNYGIIKYAQTFSKFRKTFLYLFSILTEFPRQVDLSNEFDLNYATHEDDLMFIFYPQSGSITVTDNSEQYELIKSVIVLYTNFIKNGNPTPDASTDKWPKFVTNTEYYMNINHTLSVGQHLDEKMVAFWDSVYQAVDLEF